jgi:Glycosyl transferase family 2
VADNASSDGTLDIARARAAVDQRVRVLPSPRNRGASWNWNRTVHEARGELFRWACHDDLLLPTNLEVCMVAIAAAPSHVVLVYPRTELIDEHGCVVGPFDDVCDLRQDHPHERFQVVVRDLNLINPIFGIHRSEALRSTRLLGPYAQADTVLMGEVALRGQVWELPQRLFRRRRHPQASMRAHTTAEALAAFYDTSRSGPGVLFPYARLLREHLASIARAPLPAGERARCVAALGRWRFRRRLGPEARLALALAADRVRRPLRRGGRALQSVRSRLR